MDSPAPENVADQRLSTSRQASNSVDLSRDRRKGPSILSRIGAFGVRRREEDMLDSDSELGELRTDGADAQAQTSIAGAGGGFIPLHKEPPRYIRVRPYNKKERTFNRLFLAQELHCSSAPDSSSTEKKSEARTPSTAVGKKLLKGGDAIWAADFSLDGRYLAAAGKDNIVRVFAVLSTIDERQKHEEEESLRTSSNEKLSAPVFRTKPVAEFLGHSNDILALCWSKNNFLLSSSMDKTVKLWHPSRQDCLCTFKHNDLVTSIAFHPTDDRFFLAGSLDGQLRLWSIPDKTVAFEVPTQEFITAVAFSPDGKTSICGLLSGLCLFFATEGLKLSHHIHVRSSRGRNAKGSKITGIRTIRSSDTEDADVRVLISSNDSRVRIYSLNTRMLETKFKGLENQSSQIHARFSDDGKYVISGSEDRRAYIWSLDSGEAELKDRQPFECFDAHPEVVTTAIMAPTKTRQLLSSSGDPIYDLCNPPPITLMSLDERASQSTRSDAGQEPATIGFRRPDENPAYVHRSKHNGGAIIITTDRTGTIKVFRQDCAYAKRQQNLWETGSRLSGRFTSIGRSASIVTRTSASSRRNSRRGSLSLSINAHQMPSDRIMSWRQDVEGGGRASLAGTPVRSERSMSPIKGERYPARQATGSPSPGVIRTVRSRSLAVRGSLPTSPTASLQDGSGLSREVNVEQDRRKVEDKEPTMPPTPSFSLISASGQEAQADRDDGFWNLNRWRGSFSGLRYSNSGASLAGSLTASPSVKADDDLLTPDAPNTLIRRSYAGNDAGRLGVQELVDRRRSMGTTTAHRTNISFSKGDKKAEVRSEVSDTKKRTDSGLGRLSDDFAE